MKAYGYIRVSTDEQVNQGVSLEAQQAAIERYCVAHDITLTVIVKDPGITGTSLDARPEAKTLINRVCGERATLITYKLDRLFRNAIEGMMTERQLSSAGASLVSLSEQVDTSTSDGWFTFWIQCGLAELEVRRIRERTSFALRYKLAAGQRVSHHATFGYRLVESGDEKNGKPIMVQEQDKREQEAIALMVQLKQQSYGYRAIGRRLSKLGYLSRTGNTISNKVIRSVLDRQQS